ncbi:hypothetical protein CPB86DRAFT_378730 [Serendipita vermifera]|nr:hypothetical protein CPB86DRAFT_378730 [Serendipita vermifera]
MNTMPTYSYYGSPLQIIGYDGTLQNSSSGTYPLLSGGRFGIGDTQMVAPAWSNSTMNWENQYLQPSYTDSTYSSVQTLDSTLYSSAALPEQNGYVVPLVAPFDNGTWKGTSDTPVITWANLPDNGLSPYSDPTSVVSTATSRATTASPRRADFKCIFCDKMFSKQARANACINKHPDLDPFPCQGQCGDKGCAKSYVSRETLRRHCAPPEKRMVECPYCGRLRSKQNIARHKRTCKL